MARFSNITRGWKLPLLALTGFIFAMASVFGRTPAPASEPLVEPPSSSFSKSVSGIGVIEPKSEIIQIGTDISGIVKTVFIKVGDKVSSGDPLFSLDSRDIDSRIKALEASLETAKIQAQDAGIQFDIVKNINSQGAVSREDFSRRKFAAQFAKARITEVEEELNQARTTKDRMTINAPIDGEILSVNIRPGEFVSGGMAGEPYIRMGDISTLNIRVEIDEENAGRVNADAPAKAIKRGNTSISIPLHFVRFEPYIRPKQNLAVAGQRVDTRVLQVLYALDNKDAKLFVGEQMDVFIAEGVAGKK